MKDDTILICLSAFSLKLKVRSRALLEKQTIAQEINKFPAFYGTQNSLLNYKEPDTRSSPEPTRVQSTPSHHLIYKAEIVGVCVYVCSLKL
jgi:hypothetical protein